MIFKKIFFIFLLFLIILFVFRIKFLIRTFSLICPIQIYFGFLLIICSNLELLILLRFWKCSRPFFLSNPTESFHCFMRSFSVGRPSTSLAFTGHLSSLEFRLIYAFHLFSIGFPGFLHFKVFLCISLELILLKVIDISGPVFEILWFLNLIFNSSLHIRHRSFQAQSFLGLISFFCSPSGFSNNIDDFIISSSCQIDCMHLLQNFLRQSFQDKFL